MKKMLLAVITFAVVVATLGSLVALGVMKELDHWDVCRNLGHSRTYCFVSQPDR